MNTEGFHCAGKKGKAMGTGALKEFARCHRRLCVLPPCNSLGAGAFVRKAQTHSCYIAKARQGKSIAFYSSPKQTTKHITLNPNPKSLTKEHKEKRKK